MLMRWKFINISQLQRIIILIYLLLEGGNTSHAVQLRVSASNDAQEGLYTYRVGIVSSDGKGSGAYLNINVLP